MFRSYNEYERPSASSELSFRAKDIPQSLYTCDWCSEGWQSESEVHIHMVEAHNTRILKMVNAKKTTCCIMCVRQFKSKSQLHKHIRTDHLLSSEHASRVERDIFICELCSHIFFNKQKLVIHIAMTHKGSDKRAQLECPKCRRLVRKEAMWSHFEHHRVQSVSCCPICLTKCKDRQALRTHIASHPRHYYCDTCMYLGKTAEHFHRHAEQHRQTPVEEQCLSDTYLERMFISFERFKYRDLRVSGFRGLVLSKQLKICVLCREICRTKRGMLLHALRHAASGAHCVAERPEHACPCGDRFPTRILLTQHALRAHGGGGGGNNADDVPPPPPPPEPTCEVEVLVEQLTK